jgi:Ribonuclease G/E
MNSPNGKYCIRCGAPFVLETLMKVEKEKNENECPHEHFNKRSNRSEWYC